MTGKEFRQKLLGPVAFLSGIIIPIVQIVIRDGHLQIDEVIMAVLLIAAGMAMIDLEMLTKFGRVAAKLLPWGGKNSDNGFTQVTGISREEIADLIRKGSKKKKGK